MAALGCSRAPASPPNPLKLVPIAKLSAANSLNIFHHHIGPIPTSPSTLKAPPTMVIKAAEVASAAPSLSFPREIFAALSPAPYLLAHLSPQSAKKPSLRANGRRPSEFRAPSINTGSLTHCSGSAVVRLGDTAVVCGVRGEILKASDVPNPPDAASAPEAEDEDDSEELSRLGLLVPNIELSTGSTPSHLPGAPPTVLAQSLTSRLLSLLHTTRLVRARDLRITYRPPRTVDDDEVPDAEVEEEVKAYWTLYIDILFISLDGNAFDAAWGAVISALQDTKLPKGWWDQDLETILCSDVAAEARRLSLRGLPVAASFGVFDPSGKAGRSEGQGDPEAKSWVLADPDAFEETLCRENVTVVVDCSESGKRRVRRMEKNGGGVVGRDILRDIVEAIDDRWKAWAQALGSGKP